MSKVNIRQLSQEVCSVFEDLLDEHNIKIPDDDRTGDPSEACIYGVTYGNLEDQVTDILSNFANEIKRDDLELETDTYEFTDLINGVYYINKDIETSKRAIKITETLTKVVIVDADSYEEAKREVMDEYYKCNIELNADNSAVDVEFSDDTEEYINIFGEEEFNKMEGINYGNN